MSIESNPVSASSGMLLTGFMTPDDLAKLFRISPRTLARWHASRKGPPRCSFGNLILYREETVREWLTRQEADLTVRRRRRR